MPIEIFFTCGKETGGNFLGNLISHAKILFEYREDDPVKGKLIQAMTRTYLVENQVPK